ncbi:hypothetical protein FA15DRAFT_672666 [Coprinopsis marcescibilis]|uniref:Uncharacterized protein n=1 Tax=Coprinopsis marcescibilis TaxID=230819 RepID=A0A5C3KLZ2_COPMA|nr:hypothetical protein FA15DRAFT_672666 [Coprinopsis marcescibilis]
MRSTGILLFLACTLSLTISAPISNSGDALLNRDAERRQFESPTWRDEEATAVKRRQFESPAWRDEELEARSVERRQFDSPPWKGDGHDGSAVKRDEGPTRPGWRGDDGEAQERR